MKIAHHMMLKFAKGFARHVDLRYWEVSTVSVSVLSILFTSLIIIQIAIFPGSSNCLRIITVSDEWHN